MLIPPPHPKLDAVRWHLEQLAAECEIPDIRLAAARNLCEHGRTRTEERLDDPITRKLLAPRLRNEPIQIRRRLADADDGYRGVVVPEGYRTLHPNELVGWSDVRLICGVWCTIDRSHLLDSGIPRAHTFEAPVLRRQHIEERTDTAEQIDLREAEGGE